MYATVFNTTDSPTPVGNGRTLEGGGWGPADTTDDAVKRGLERGDLVKVDASPEDAGLAGDAAERTEQLHARDEELDGWSADQVKAAAYTAGVGTTEMNRDEAQEALVWSDVELKKPNKREVDDYKSAVSGDPMPEPPPPPDNTQGVESGDPTDPGVKPSQSEE